MARNIKETAQAAGIDLSQVDVVAGRRAFMKGLGIGAAGAAALGVGGVTAAQAQAVTDADIVNFALNLEYLEAEFYLRAATGSGLSAADSGGAAAGAVTGGRRVNFTNQNVAAYAREIADDERKHVVFLRAALGGAAVPRPRIDIGPAFAAAAQAAGLGAGFDAYANDTSFLLAAYIFEDVGVTAYNGAAPLVTDRTILSAAASILAVEAYHAGIIRTVLFVNGAARETALISNLRANLSGAQDDAGVGVVSNPNVVLADANALAFKRTTRQVLNIVYGRQNAASGLFFPAGLNGRIR